MGINPPRTRPYPHLSTCRWVVNPPHPHKPNNPPRTTPFVRVVRPAPADGEGGGAGRRGVRPAKHERSAEHARLTEPSLTPRVDEHRCRPAPPRHPLEAVRRVRQCVGRGRMEGHSTDGAEHRLARSSGRRMPRTASAAAGVEVPMVGSSSPKDKIDGGCSSSSMAVPLIPKQRLPRRC
jgi:hypothetical protein